MDDVEIILDVTKCQRASKREIDEIALPANLALVADKL
jgi:hypothetical protein